MERRKTVVFDIDVMKKLYALQSKRIKESSKSVSFSKVLNDVCKKQLGIK